MKRLSWKQRLYNIRITRSRTRKHLFRRDLKLLRRLQQQPRYLAYTRHKALKAPEVFFLNEKRSRSVLLCLIKDMYARAQESKNILIDFRKTAKMITCGTLLFTAELRNIRNCYPAIQIKPIRPRNKKVDQVLKQVGIYKTMNYNCRITPTDADVVNWKASHGTLVQGEKYNEIVDDTDNPLTKAVDSKLFCGVAEAMNNVTNHAYNWHRELHDVHHGDEAWWMFSQNKDGYLSVVFCDLGCGIPTSLPFTKKDWWTKILSLFGDAPHNHGVIIQKAIEHSMTSTGKGYRGKGLMKICEVLQANPGSELIIFSNNGLYALTKNQDSQAKHYQDSIQGTLILWRIPISRSTT